MIHLSLIQYPIINVSTMSIWEQKLIGFSLLLKSICEPNELIEISFMMNDESLLLCHWLLTCYPHIRTHLTTRIFNIKYNNLFPIHWLPTLLPNERAVVAHNDITKIIHLVRFWLITSIDWYWNPHQHLCASMKWSKITLNYVYHHETCNASECQCLFGFENHFVSNKLSSEWIRKKGKKEKKIMFHFSRE